MLGWVKVKANVIFSAISGKINLRRFSWFIHFLLLLFYFHLWYMCVCVFGSACFHCSHKNDCRFRFKRCDIKLDSRQEYHNNTTTTTTTTTTERMCNVTVHKHEKRHSDRTHAYAHNHSIITPNESNVKPWKIHSALPWLFLFALNYNFFYNFFFFVIFFWFLKTKLSL